MRIACLVLAVCFGASASAQERPPASATTGERVILVAGAAAGGLAVGLVGPFVPVTVVLATYGTSALLGLDPSLSGVVLDTAIGMGIGAGIGSVAFAYYAATDQIDGLGVLIPFFIGVGAGAIATGVVHGIRVEPAALAAPTGEPSVGLSLRLAL